MKQETREAAQCVVAHLSAVIGMRMSELRDSEASRTLGISAVSNEAVERAASAALDVLIDASTGKVDPKTIESNFRRVRSDAV